MASKTTNYNLDMPGYTDIADIDVINGNMNKIDMQMKKNADSAQQSKYIVSDEYSATKTYEVGDYCIRENVLYKCKTAITTGEAFDSNKWVQTTCGTGFRELNSNLVELKENSTIVKKSVGKFINDKGTLDGKAKLVNLPHNLLNPTLETTTQNGVTCTNNGDGTYTCSGTPTAITIFDICSFDDKTYNNVKLVGCPNNKSNKDTLLRIRNSSTNVDDLGDGKIINGAYNKVQIRIDANEENLPLTFKPMLTTDLDATYEDFVPYSGYEVKSCGKNLFNPSSILEGTYDDYTNTWTVIDNTKKALDMTFKENTQYTFSAYIKQSNANSNIRLNVIYTDGSNKSTFLYSKSTEEVYIFETSSRGKTIKEVRLYYGSGGTATFRNLQIEEGTTATDYVPYQGEDTVTVTQDTNEAWLDTYENETNILSPLSVTAMYGTNLQGNEIMTDLYESDNEVAKLKNDLGGLSFSVSGTTLSITDGTNTWTLESN